MEQPATPFFLFDPKRHFIDLCEVMEIGGSVSRLTLVNGWDSRCIVYDSAGIAWGFRFAHSKKQYSWLDKLLAQFYNPVRHTTVTWHSRQSYSLSELQNAYLDALAHDDDILTQFVEEKDLRRQIQHSSTFSDLVETWHWMKTDSD
jgi:hypothetical protein